MTSILASGGWPILDMGQAKRADLSLVRMENPGWPSNTLVLPWVWSGLLDRIVGGRRTEIEVISQSPARSPPNVLCVL